SLIRRCGFAVILMASQFNGVKPSCSGGPELAGLRQDHGFEMSYRTFGPLSSLSQGNLPAHLFKIALQKGDVIAAGKKHGISEMPLRHAFQNLLRLREPSEKDGHLQPACPGVLIFRRECYACGRLLKRLLIFTRTLRNASSHQ